MILNQEQEYLNANPGKTRADFIAWANETVYTLMPGKPCGYGTIFLMFGGQIADAIGDYLQANLPRFYELYINGNVDFGTEAVQGLIGTLPAQLPVEVIDGIRNIGRTGTIRIDGVSSESLAQAEAEYAIESKRANWAALLNEILWPNLAAASVPTVNEFKALLNV